MLFFAHANLANHAKNASFHSRLPSGRQHTSDSNVCFRVIREIRVKFSSLIERKTRSFIREKL